MLNFKNSVSSKVYVLSGMMLICCFNTHLSAAENVAGSNMKKAENSTKNAISSYVNAWKNAERTPQGREVHPCVYLTPEDVKLAKERVQKYAWAKKLSTTTVKNAEQWINRDFEWYKSVMPGKGACFAYGATGCPICGKSWGTWGGAKCSFDTPGKVKCQGGHILPDAEHTDTGTGYVGKDGRIHYFVGSYNAWVVETLQYSALHNLSLAYTLTDDEKYAETAAQIFDLIAEIYPSCDKGSWDYPSKPPSGRLSRPWYQVARVLVVFIDWYDKIYNSPALDKPSVVPSLTRRQNIEKNIILNAAEYCYVESLKGRLTNGTADYVRGAMAAGCLLGIPLYIDWAYTGPYGINTMIDNNIDRDGRYYETSTIYEHHTRELYTTFAEPLFNYRSKKYPDGINLYNNAKFQNIYLVPDAMINCTGKTPQFGDSSPDIRKSGNIKTLFSGTDYRHAEYFSSRVTDQEGRKPFNWLLTEMTGGKLDDYRLKSVTAYDPWILFHGIDSAELKVVEPDKVIPEKVNKSVFFGQKGFVFLRNGNSLDPLSQAVMLRFGPALNHSNFDDLNLSYYALGYELGYDLGYGWGSTHAYVGWSKQTASHNLVLVNEKSMNPITQATGGSLYQFADFPGLAMAEVSSENCYKEQGVTQYRRLAALAGEGKNKYLLDIFRVNGGKQHDYVFHSLTTTATFENIEFGVEEDTGSLAGKEYNWGNMVLNDGDLDGYPNKPYWVAPPGNGLGFVMNPKRVVIHDGLWKATWHLPDNNSFIKLSMLPQKGCEIITAVAPGIYSSLPKSRYVYVRRKTEVGSAATDLRSVFIGIYEPLTGAATAQCILNITQLENKDVNEPILPAGVCVQLEDGIEDYFLTSGEYNKPYEFLDKGSKYLLTGTFAYIRMKDKLPQKMCMFGTKEVSFGTTKIVADNSCFTGKIVAVDTQNRAVITTEKVPLGDVLKGQVVMFTNPGYSRNTVYYIGSVEKLPSGETLIKLNCASLVLGTGILESDPVNSREFTSLLTHEYARSNSRPGTQFFSGKLIRCGDVSTKIVETKFGQLMDYKVEDTNGLKQGDRFEILDLQPGDEFVIPVKTSVVFKDKDNIGIYSTTKVNILINSKVVAKN
ncbi:MAG: hypothetical protein WC955_04210 [Elusimicrobiota bacterium]